MPGGADRMAAPRRGGMRIDAEPFEVRIDAAVLARISHTRHGLRDPRPPWPADRAGKPRRAIKGHRASGLTHPVGGPWGSWAALRVAPRRPPAASPASTVASATLFGPLLAGRPPGRDADRGGYEKCGLTACQGVHRAGFIPGVSPPLGRAPPATGGGQKRVLRGGATKFDWRRIVMQRRGSQLDVTSS